jgi:2-C-methyl-D-erythritol 4-phosphate cytidylyltransferase
MAADAGPKQYLVLGRKTMLEHTLDALLSDARVERAFAVVAPSDTHWQTLGIADDRVEFIPAGGGTRSASVRNGLLALATRYDDNDRVLVHDAARPCLARADLARLIDAAADDDEGGLLAVPVTDTLKRADGDRVGVTIDRAALWRAQTPQLFRCGSLRAALAACENEDVTDEASAMERAGHAPRLVPGSTSNLKVTTPADLAIARAVLAEQGRL